jgi:hypothetical protein
VSTPISRRLIAALGAVIALATLPADARADASIGQRQLVAFAPPNAMSSPSPAGWWSSPWVAIGVADLGR